MKKGRRASPGETQLHLLPDERTLFSELGKRAAAVNAATEDIVQGLAKGTGLARIKNALAPLRDELRGLASLAGQLDAVETSWSERIEREFLEMEAAVREALKSRGWRVEGQWPKLYVERGIAIEFDERNRSFKVSDRKIAGATVADIVAALEPLVYDLIPRNFSETRFIQSLADAYDECRESKSSQVPILEVYRQLVFRQQKPNFWRDARSDAFVGMSMDQFRARLSRALEKAAITTPDGRELRLLPPIDPKHAVFLYQPAEERFGFVGRIEFVSTKTLDA
jgi:hypothetical protein